MSIKPQQEQKLRSLLKNYKVSSDIIQLTLLQKSQTIQDWKQFIEDQIIPKKQNGFTQQLKSILSQQNINGEPMKLTDPKIQLTQELQKVYSDIKPRNINVRSLKAVQLKESKWSDELMSQLETQIQKLVDESYKKTKTFKEFLDQVLQIVYDLIARRQGLLSFFRILQKLSKRHNTQASSLISKININDFVILLTRSIKNKDYVGKLLSQNGIPIPVLFQTGNNIEYNPDLLENILSVNSYHLILNIGTPQTKKCGKTALISSLFSFKAKNFQGSHFSNVLNFYTNFTFGIKYKSILADFNGCQDIDLNSPLNTKLKNYANKASLIILHAKDNQILQEMILDHQNYKQLVSKAQKIILIIRDSKYSTLKEIQQVLSKNLQKKTTIFIADNLSVGQQNLQKFSIQTISEIIQKKANEFHQKKLKFEDIQKKQYMKQQKKQQKQEVINIISDLMRVLNGEDYKRNKILPITTLEEEIYEICKQIKSMKQNQHEDQIKYYKRKQQNQKLYHQLLEKRKEIELSDFIKKVIEILDKNQTKYNKILMESIVQWRNKKLQPLKIKYIQQINELHNNRSVSPNIIKQKIRKTLQDIDQFQLSTDAILNEIIIYRQTHQDKQQLKSIIHNYYNDSYQRMVPINIVEGKTLRFGNQYLKSFVKNLSQVYLANPNKKVYVISVIGAQSSAKSTLLNMLFRCNFQTSAGRCTKGVYFSICQLQDMVIVVFDTQGLLSISTRDAAFDNQIASFILKISNLIIINNKGQLTANLKELLKVCMYVLSCLHKDEKKSQYTPQKLIFTLRDQIKPSGNFQQEMVAQIKNELQSVKSEESIDYRNFFSIETQDIFSLPNAFQQNNGISGRIGSYSTYYPVFGKCILAIRNRIIKLLKDSTPQKNLESFYNQASMTWQTIQKCGKDIFNYKTFNEIIIKSKLSQILDNIIKDHKISIESKYHKFMKKIEGLDSKQLQQQVYQIELNQICKTNKQRLKEDFLKQASKICSNLGWIQDFYVKINDLCNSYSICYNQEMNKMKKRKVSKQKMNEFQKDLNDMVQNLLNDKSDDKTIEKKFQQKKQQLQNQYRNTINSYQKDRNIFAIKLLKSFNSKLRLINQKLKLKISSSEECIQSYLKLKQYSNNYDVWVELFKFNITKTFTLKQEDKIYLFNLVNTSFKNLQSELSQKIINSKILNFAEIQTVFHDWMNMMQNQIQKIEKQLQSLIKQWTFLSVSIKQGRLRFVLFGLIFTITINQVFQNNLNILKQQQTNAIKLIQLKHKQVQKALKYQ